MLPQKADTIKCIFLAIFSNVHMTLPRANKVVTDSPKKGHNSWMLTPSFCMLQGIKLLQHISKFASVRIAPLCLVRYCREKDRIGRDTVSKLKRDLWPLQGSVPTPKSLAMRLFFINREVAVLSMRWFLMEAVTICCEDGQQPLLFLLGLR